MAGVVKGNTVLACFKQDGFYYKGLIVNCPSNESVVVRFCDCSHQTTSVSQLILVGGAGSQPQLRNDDYVLCCMRESQGTHCSEYGVCDFYIPAQVKMVPRESGHSLFYVTTFNGRLISCTRSCLKKISESRYHSACSLIVECQQQTSSHIDVTNEALQHEQFTNSGDTLPDCTGE